MTPELAYFLKINVAIALFYAFYRLFFHKDTFFHWRRMALLCFFAISMLYPLLNIQGMDKSSRTNGGNGRSLCNHHPSGASSYSFTRACNELARVYHAARESYLLERNVITSHTFLCTTGQHHPVTLPMLKSKIQGVRVHLLKKNHQLFFLPLDIHTPTITYGI